MISFVRSRKGSIVQKRERLYQQIFVVCWSLWVQISIESNSPTGILS